jgi:hypothetical protein
MSQTEYLSPDGLKLWQLEDGSLVMKRECKKTLLGAPRRALPLTNPDEFIVLSDLDGNEVGVLRRVEELEPASQAILREALAHEYVLERIERILEVEREPLSGQTRWRVQLASEANSATTTSIEDASESASQERETASEDEGKGAADDESEKRGLAKMTNFLSLNRDKDRVEETVTAHEREFTIGGPEDVQTARYPHIFIVDTERNRYEIPDCEALDLESRRAAERFF